MGTLIASMGIMMMHNVQLPAGEIEPRWVCMSNWMGKATIYKVRCTDYADAAGECRAPNTRHHSAVPSGHEGRE